jgi:hypothetical protein
MSLSELEILNKLGKVNNLRYLAIVRKAQLKKRENRQSQNKENIVVMKKTVRVIPLLKELFIQKRNPQKSLSLKRKNPRRKAKTKRKRKDIAVLVNRAKKVPQLLQVHHLLLQKIKRRKRRSKSNKRRVKVIVSLNPRKLKLNPNLRLIKPKKKRSKKYCQENLLPRHLRARKNRVLQKRK